MADGRGPTGAALEARVGAEASVEINRWWTIARIVTNVAHDLNNALQVISGNVEMLQSRGGLDELTERRARSIATQAARAAGAVDQLLAYARDTPAAVQAVDAHDLCALALAFRSMSLGRARIATALSRDREEPFLVNVERRLLLQLVLDLLLSAESRLSGRPSAAIAVRVGRDAGAVTIVIDATAGAGGDPPAPKAGSALAEAIAAEASAALAARQGFELTEAAGSSDVRHTLRIPDPAQAAESVATLSR